jgi:uncharacterized lipoprotein YmbA
MRIPLLVTAGLLGGCAKKPIVENHYYSLVLEASEGRIPPERVETSARVDIITVTLPDFLKSRSLVLQVNTNEVTHAEQHHWGEPLDFGIRKILAWDLSAAIPTLDIAPGPGRDADCSLTVEFDRFHASNDARVLVSGRYTWTRGEALQRQEFDVSQVQYGDGYTSAVAGMRQAIEALSQVLQPVVAGCSPQASD